MGLSFAKWLKLIRCSACAWKSLDSSFRGLVRIDSDLPVFFDTNLASGRGSFFQLVYPFLCCNDAILRHLFCQGRVPCSLGLLWPPHLQGLLWPPHLQRLRVSQKHHALLLVGSYGSSTYPRRTVVSVTFRVQCLGHGCSIGHAISQGLHLYIAGRQSEAATDHVHWPDLQHIKM